MPSYDETAICSLASVYADHRVVCYRTALRVTHDPVVAEDAVHDVFVQLPNDFLTRVPAGQRRPYLIRAARNTALHLVRREYKGEALTEQRMKQMPSSELAPDDELWRTELQIQLRCACDCLPARCHAVMRAKLDQDPSNQEIAETLGISRKAVEKQVARGYRLLRGNKHLARLR